MKRLAILSNGLSGGGAERVLINLANGLTRQGVHVDLILLNNRDDYAGLLEPDVNIIRLGGRRALFSFFSLRRALVSSSPDLLLSGQIHANLLAMAVKLTYSYWLPVVLTVHNSIDGQGRSYTLKDRFLRLLSRLVFRYADRIVSVSRGVEKDVIRRLKIPKNRSVVIYNPIVSDEALRLGSVHIEDPWLVSGKIPVIVSAGRLTRQKDYSTALKAIHRVQTKGVSVRYMILGQGEVRPELEREAELLGLENCVRFLGFQPNPFIYLRRADLLLLSSAWEGFGNVLVEALMFGTPVVSTDAHSGPAEILEYGSYGFLAPVGDAERLADGIIQTLENRPDKDALIRRSRDFTIDAICREYMSMFHSVFTQNNHRAHAIKRTRPL